MRAPKLLAVLSSTATTFDLAVAEVAALMAAGAESDDAILIGPLCPIRHEGLVLGANLMFARPAGALMVLHVVPTDALDLSTPQARRTFRDAILQALGRHCRRVRCYTCTRALVAAAREPAVEQADEALLLH